MAMQKNPERSPMELLKMNLKRQNEQGKALVQLIDHVENIHGEMKEQYTDMGIMVQEVRDSVTLTYEEQNELQSIVFTSSIELTKAAYPDNQLSNDDFKKEVGAFRRRTWSKLKKKMNKPRYSAIRRVDYKEAKQFVESLKLADFLEG